MPGFTPSPKRFRVWCSDEGHPDGRMFLPEDAPSFFLNMSGDLIKSGKRDGWDTLPLVRARIGHSGIRIMQSTGLKDLEGAEVFEGDVLAFDVLGQEVRGYVQWSDTCALWQVIERIVGHELWRVALRGRVVGNVFENPDLIQ